MNALAWGVSRGEPDFVGYAHFLYGGMKARLQKSLGPLDLFNNAPGTPVDRYIVQVALGYMPSGLIEMKLLGKPIYNQDHWDQRLVQTQLDRLVDQEPIHFSTIERVGTTLVYRNRESAVVNMIRKVHHNNTKQNGYPLRAVGNI